MIDLKRINTEEMDEPEAGWAQDVAQEIVCTFTDYSGEWTGSDYWSFSGRFYLFVGKYGLFGCYPYS